MTSHSNDAEDQFADADAEDETFNVRSTTTTTNNLYRLCQAAASAAPSATSSVPLRTEPAVRRPAFSAKPSWINGIPVTLENLPKGAETSLKKQGTSKTARANTSSSEKPQSKPTKSKNSMSSSPTEKLSDTFSKKPSDSHILTDTRLSNATHFSLAQAHSHHLEDPPPPPPRQAPFAARKSPPNVFREKKKLSKNSRKRRHEKNREHNEFIRIAEATAVPDCTIRQEVARATSIVTAEVRSGVWPPLSKHNSNREDARLRLHRAAAALEQFSTEIILPSLSSGSKNKKDPPRIQNATKQDTETNGKMSRHGRHFMGTLILLREAIMMNLESIFGYDPTAVGEGDHKDEEGGSNTEEQSKDNEQDSFPGKARMLQQNKEEEHAFSAHLLATGLVLSAAERLGPELYLQVLNVLDKYDTGHEEFGSCLEQTPNGKTTLITPSGKVLDREEAVAARVSLDLARDQHPLVRRHQRRSIMETTHPLVQVYVKDSHQTPLRQFSLPRPTACHVCMVEKTGTEHST